jgi:hypothetical protein
MSGFHGDFPNSCQNLSRMCIYYVGACGDPRPGGSSLTCITGSRRGGSPPGTGPRTTLRGLAVLRARDGNPAHGRTSALMPPEPAIFLKNSVILSEYACKLMCNFDNEDLAHRGHGFLALDRRGSWRYLLSCNRPRRHCDLACLTGQSKLSSNCVLRRAAAQSARRGARLRMASIRLAVRVSDHRRSTRDA